MAEFPALLLWTDAYLADTIHLTQAESGCYLHLLMCAWRTEDCSLPDDDETLSRFAKCDMRTWRRQRLRVLEFFFRKGDDGRWRQKRLTKEREFVSKRAEAQRKNALVRWQAKSRQNNESVMPPHLRTGCERDAPIPTPIPKERDSLTGVQKESAPALPTPPPKLVRGSRIPDDWQPSEDELAYACTQGMSYQQAESIAVDFQQYWRAKAGKEAVKCDWHLTWQRWVRHSKAFSQGNGNGQRQPFISPKAQIATELFNEMAREFVDGNKTADRGNIREFTPKLVSLRSGS